MKFGQFYIHEQAPGKSAKEVYDDCLEQCRVADELGFDEVWLGEHRVSEYGTLPDTLVFAGAVAQVTKQIRIGDRRGGVAVPQPGADRRAGGDG